MGFLSSFFKKDNTNDRHINEIEKSALNGNEQSILLLAQDSTSGVNALKKTYSHDEKLKWNKLAAEQGDTDSQYNYGLLIFQSLDLKDNNSIRTHRQDIEEVIFWFKKAAKEKEKLKATVVNLEGLLTV